VAFCQVEIKIAIQGNSLYCFHAYMYKPKLVHLYQSSSLLLSSLPTVALDSLRLLYLFLYS
jgi:hypothetical protein